MKSYIYDISNIGTIKKISATVLDSINSSGLLTNKVSNILTLDGNSYTWLFGDKNVGSKYFEVASLGISPVVNSKTIRKYNNTILSDWTGADGDEAYLYASGRLLLSAFNADTGFIESWVSLTAFVGLTWGGLMKAFMNGWKLTTANANVASCVWTGITSGTTKTGASGYTDVTTTIDTGVTSYRMVYELATPTTTQLNLLSQIPKSLRYVSLPYDNLFY
jgi:hypothetical protein